MAPLNPTVIVSRPVHSIDSGGFERGHPAALAERAELADAAEKEGVKLKEPLKRRRTSATKTPPTTYTLDGGIAARKRARARVQ